MPTGTTKIPIRAQIGYLHFPNGRIVRVKPADHRRFSLKEQQKAVGGYIELIVPHSTLRFDLLIVNEDGERLSLPPNVLTAELIHSIYPKDKPIYGIALGVRTEKFDASLPTINRVMKEEIE